ncbi:MAG: nuclear transport factor 2 family protein [Bryobacteraceae bacterium]
MHRSLVPLVALAFLGGYLLGARREYRADVMAADRAFDLATAERGASGWTSFFASDGKMVRSGGAIVTGPGEVRSLMEPLFADKDNSLRWTPEFAETSRAGDLGYTVGSSKFRHKDAAGRMVENTGRYVTIWRKTSGGWKVALDIGTSGPAKPVDW